MTEVSEPLLVCAATERELKTFWQEGENGSLPEGVQSGRDGDFVFALTGVGIPQTLGRVTALIQTLRPVRILNIGIAGAYPGSGLAIGDVVAADSEVYGDVGFELPEDPGFQPIRAVPFGVAYATPFTLEPDPRWTQPLDGAIRIGRGCTVNACTGTERTGRLRETLYGALFETMEGAAVAQAAAQEGIPVCEVRAISNIASRRDMRPENIALALANLRRHLVECKNEG